MTNPTLERLIDIFRLSDGIQVRITSEGYVVAKRDRREWVYWGDEVEEDPMDISGPLYPGWTTGLNRNVYSTLQEARTCADEKATSAREKEAEEKKWAMKKNKKPDAGVFVEIAS